MTATNSVYRHFDKDGLLLYVGCSINIPQRMLKHASFSNWWSRVTTITIERYDSEFTARDAERTAIETEDPEFNKNCRGGATNAEAVESVQDALRIPNFNYTAYTRLKDRIKFLRLKASQEQNQ